MRLARARGNLEPLLYGSVDVQNRSASSQAVEVAGEAATSNLRAARVTGVLRQRPRSSCPVKSEAGLGQRPADRFARSSLKPPKFTGGSRLQRPAYGPGFEGGNTPARVNYEHQFALDILKTWQSVLKTW